MTGLAQIHCGNLLLQALHPTDFDRLRPHLQRVAYRSGFEVASAGEPIEFVFFPEGAVTACLEVMQDGTRIAAAMIGCEGLVGHTAVLGSSRWAQDVVVRAGEATALKLDAACLEAAFRGSSTLADLLLRFGNTLMLQMGRTIVSNLLHPMERRLARWILLYHDRVQGNEITITHKEIGIMLGIRRASITEVLHVIEGVRAISNTRGMIVVRDRALLEAMAGETYGQPEAEYRRLIAPFGKGAARTE